MAAGRTATSRNAGHAPGRADQVSDEEVEEAITLFGGDPREAVRALVGALHHLVSKGYARGQVRVVGSPAACRARPDVGAH